MSLILDALKKAQQIRLKGSKEEPLPTYSYPETKKGSKSLGKRWMVIGVGLASLVAFTLIFLRLTSPPSPSVPSRTVARIEKKPPVLPEKKKPQEPAKDILSSSKDILSPEFIDAPKEVTSPSKDILSSSKDILSSSKDILSSSKDILSSSKDKEPAEGLPYVGAALSGRPPESIERPKEEKPKVDVPAPSLPPAVSPRSTASLKEKASAKSIEVKREGDKDRPLSSEILNHFNLGVQLHNQGEFSKAIQAYQKVIKLDPTYIEAYNNLGIIYQEIGDFDRALGAYQKSIEINPQYEKGHNNMGILFYLKGRHEEALEAFQKALAINVNNIESHINLGVIFKKQGQLNKAIESYQKALDINPLHTEIHYNIALLYEQLGNVEMAIDHYQQFIKLSSPFHSDLVSKVQRHVNYLMKERKEKKR